MDRKKVFISYAHEKFDARSLAKVLNDSGFEAVWDEAFIQPGDSLKKEIKEKISRSDYVLPVLTPETVSKHTWLIRELQETILQECIQKRELLIPILTEGLTLHALVNENPALEKWALNEPLYLKVQSGNSDFRQVVEALKAHKERTLSRNYTFFELKDDNLEFYRTGYRCHWGKNRRMSYVQTVDGYLLFDYAPDDEWKHFLVCDPGVSPKMTDILESCKDIYVSGREQGNEPGKNWIWFLDLRRNLTRPQNDPYCNNCL